jgi:capsular polysaccharide biosynthesis protein
MQSNEDQPIQVVNEEANLLDLFLPIAENLKLLVLGPLLVGLCALGISYFLPKTYVSSAIVNTPVTVQPTPAEHVAASLMTSAIVLDPVIEGLKLRDADEPIEIARENLRGDVKAVAGRNDKLVTLTVMANTPERAQAIANAILKQTFIESRLKKTDLDRITAQLETARATEKKALAAAAVVAQRLETTQAAGTTGSDMARGYADLLNSASLAQSKAAAIEERLQSLSEANLVQAPTLPQKAAKPVKALITAAATLGAFILFLVLVMLRQYLNHAALNPLTNEKLKSIRLALSLTTKK